MTNQEAIRVLQAIKEHPSMGVYLPDEYEALDLAIKALEIDNAPTVTLDLCETCKRGDVCKLSTKKVSYGRTTTCCKYEGRTGQ